MFTDDQLKQLTQVLDERLAHSLAPLHADIRTLKDGQERLETRLTTLEQGQLRLEQRQEALEKRQATLELKVEVVNQRVISAEQSIKDAIRESQQDTINVLSEMIHEAYSLNEQRIQRIEDELNLPPLPPSAHEA